MRYLTIVALFFLLNYSCVTQKTPQAEPAAMAVKKTVKAKNIILMIGDGMGLTQISAGTYNNNNSSNFERFPITGLHKCYASNNLITDSAAGATAFACGQKTYNGAIGVNPDTMPIVTILEMAKKHSLKTGLVASSSIVHATPASFFAHNKFRNNYEEIAADITSGSVDFFVGGGKSYFENRESDERNITEELKANGYVISDFISNDIGKIKIDKSQKFGFLTANQEPLPFSQGRDYMEDGVAASLEYLSDSETGFFLMIEGSQIDWGGHANDFNYVLSEWAEFNKLIGQVLDWAQKDGETLVIVTADHETGGLAIQNGSELNNLQGAFTSDYHTGTFIPVFAKGPGQEMFSGIYENTAIFNKMLSCYSWYD